MNAQLIQSIIDGNPAITLSVNAADLRNIILSIVQGERIRTQAKIEKYREQPILTREQAAKKQHFKEYTEPMGRKWIFDPRKNRPEGSI